MGDAVNSTQGIEPKDKKIFNLKAEKLIREASDNFVYFKDYKKALKQINEVINIDTNHTKAHLLKGDILLVLDKDEEALNAYEQAILTSPKCAQAYGSKASVLDMLGRIKEALAYSSLAFEYIVKSDRELLTSLYDQKISLLCRLKRFEDAKALLSKATNELCKDDSMYLISCYQGLIEESYKEKRRKHELVSKMSLRLVY